MSCWIGIMVCSLQFTVLEIDNMIKFSLRYTHTRVNTTLYMQVLIRMLVYKFWSLEMTFLRSTFKKSQSCSHSPLY